MTKINAVIIRRSGDENTVALVSAECDPEMVCSVDDLFGAISRAVTRWAQQEAGKSLLESNGGDINVGDLATEGIDADLCQELAKEGVTDLKVTAHAGEVTHWDYDDNLFEELNLNDGKSLQPSSECPECGGTMQPHQCGEVTSVLCAGCGYSPDLE